MALSGANGQAYTCYQVVEHNTGIPALYNTALDSVACSLKTLVNNTGSQGFVVLGYDLYPALAFVDPYETYRERYETAVARAEAAYQSFVLVTKEHRQEGEIAYRLKIKFPSLSPFDELTPFERGGIEAKVLETLEQKAAAGEYSTGSNAGVEIAVLEKLKGYFQAVIDETFSLEGDLLALSGFERLTFDGPTTIEVSNNTSLAAAGGKIYDYAGLKNQDVFLRSNLQAAYDSIQLFDPPAVIITASNMTYSGGFNAAESTFDSLPFAFVLWLHFDADKDSLYIKGKTNLTEQEAQVMVDEWYEQATEEYWSDEAPVQAAAPDDPNRDNIGSSRNFSCSDDPHGIYDCTKYDGSSFRKWRAYCCLLPTVSDFPPESAKGGMACGFLDGLLETMLFLDDINRAATEIVLKASIPGYALGELIVRFAKGLTIKQIWKEELQKLENFKNAISIIADLATGDGVSLFIDLSPIIQKAIEKIYPDLVSADKKRGYIVGRVLFEVVLYYCTGGAADIKNVGKLGESFWDFIVNLSKKSAKEIEEALAAFLKNSGNTFFANRCTFLATGCFVSGTFVLAGERPIPIEQISPGEWVYAYKDEDRSQLDFQASLYDLKDVYNEARTYDYSGWSLDEGDLLEIKLEIGQNTIERNDIKLIRPRKWLNKVGISRVGDQIWLSIPEQGVNDLAKVTDFKPYICPTPSFDKNDRDCFDLCPVTGIFTHTSNDVWELIFHNADTIRCTFSHPIFSLDINDWRAAGELESGERVLSKAGNSVLVSKKKLPGRFTVYNLEVGGLHNFLVGRSGIAVHNSCLIEEVVRKLRTAYREMMWLDPAKYLRLNPIEKLLAEMPEWKFNRFVAELRGIGVEGADLIRAEWLQPWEALFSDQFLRKNLNKLAKVDDYANNFGKSFGDIGDEFANVPASQRSGWVDHLEFRTNGKQVNKAGGRAPEYGSFNSTADIPQKYSSDNRFDNLSFDPATNSTNSAKRQEAMAGLEAESQGLIDGPIYRDQTGNFEFIDGSGNPIDVKAPRGGFVNASQVGGSIKSQLLDPDVKVLFDATWIDDVELSSIRSWLHSNVNPSDLERVIEVNSNLFQ